MEVALRDIAGQLGGELIGDAGLLIARIGPLDGADARTISFLAHPKYRSQLAGSLAGCVIVSPALRSSILCRKEVTLTRGAVKAPPDGVWVLTDARPESAADLAPERVRGPAEVKFRSAIGTATLEHPEFKSMLVALHTHRPGAMQLPDLTVRASEILGAPVALSDITAMVMYGFRSSLVMLRSALPPLALTLSDRPCASARPLSRVRTRSVSKRPGARLLTRILGPSSRASTLAIAATPGRRTFDVSRFGIGWRTDDDVMKRTEPSPSILGVSARRMRIGPPISSSNDCAHWSSVMPSTSPGGGPPALMRMPSKPPSLSSTALESVSTAPGLEMSTATYEALGPILAAAFCRDASSRDISKTEAPSSASTCAMALPSPRLPPPMRKRFPFRPRSI